MLSITRRDELVSREVAIASTSQHNLAAKRIIYDI